MENINNLRIEDWQARYLAATADFMALLLSEQDYRAKLHSLGFRGSEIDLEVLHHWPAWARGKL